MTDILVWSVDRSWGRVKANLDGDMYPSDDRKFHVDRGDSTAKCSRVIFLNSLDGTLPIGFGGAIYADQPTKASELTRDDVCRRCVPIMPKSDDLEPSA